MSIPQICPDCCEHISGPHAPGCCYGTPEYAHIGWPNVPGSGNANINYVGSLCGSHPVNHAPTMEELSRDGYADTASAIRRLLEYLNDEPDEPVAQEVSGKGKILSRLNAKANELRKEAAGMYNVDARAKRTFAADILERLVEEISEI